MDTTLGQLVSIGEYKTIEDALTEDLSFVSRPDISDLEYPLEYGYAKYTGALYLRCDEGNPADLFEDIEIISIVVTDEGDNITDLVRGNDSDGYVLDNLSFKYFLDSALNSDSNYGENAVIQNCTVEWGANRVHMFESDEPTIDYAFIGDSIYNLMYNVTIKDCYMRQAGNACTFESSEDISRDSLGTYTVTGNLIENCGQGIRTYLIDAEEQNLFEKIEISDNMILYTGDSFNNACGEGAVAIDLGTDIQFAEETIVTGNVLIGSTCAMIRITDAITDITFSDNVIVQYEDGGFLLELDDGEASLYMMSGINGN